MIQVGKNKLLEGERTSKIIEKFDYEYNFRFSLEIAMIIQCGLKVSDKILKRPESVWSNTPRLSYFDIPSILISTISSISLKNEPLSNIVTKKL